MLHPVDYAREIANERSLSMRLVEGGGLIMNGRSSRQVICKITAMMVAESQKRRKKANINIASCHNQRHL